jgi:hypothetical protein
LPGTDFAFGDVKVKTLPLHHPGGCVGFRFEMPGAVVVVATDYEPPADPDPEVVEFFDGATLLLADMQYRDAEYAGEIGIGGDPNTAMSREGWGHAPPSRLLPMLLCCPRLPRQVRIVHHDPKRPDTDLQLFCDESIAFLEQRAGGRAMDFQFAKESEIFRL